LRIAAGHLIEDLSATRRGRIEDGVDERGQLLPVVRQKRLRFVSARRRR